jgi:hypothetical protein
VTLLPFSKPSRYFPTFSKLKELAAEFTDTKSPVSLRELKSRTLMTPRGEFRLMANGDVDFCGMNITKYGLAPLKKWRYEDNQWHDQPVKRAA